MSARGGLPALALPATLAALAAVAACRGGRDYVPPSLDVRAARGAGASYVHVARRPLCVLGVAEATGLSPDVARAAGEHLADALDGCATELGRRGTLVEGAARVAASIGADGTVEAVALTTTPGDAVKAQALLCIVSPVKLLSFPAVPLGADRATSRALVVEATWGLLQESGDGGVAGTSKSD
jgi:hypothetical protein